jgi:hypothetical protein
LPLTDTGEEWWLTAVLPGDPDAWELVADGYDAAAGLIADHVSATTADNDRLIWPFIFVIRHATELRLKAILALSQRLDGQPSRELMEYRHNLGKAWKDARDVMLALFPGERKPIRTIDRWVSQLTELDVGGDTFRYPQDAKGRASVTAPDQLSFKVVWDQYTEAATLLDGCIGGIWARFEFEDDLRGEYS